MLLKTTRFGDIEITPDQPVAFVKSILGFEQLNNYVILEHDTESPFQWLQAVEDTNVAFVITQPFWFYPQYDFELKQEYVELLEAKSAEELAVYCLLVIPEDPKKITANLKAPIIINISKKKGIQLILEKEDYSIKQLVFTEAMAREGE